MSIDKIEREFRKAVAGKPYRPSNGSEGEGFMENFCFRCRKDNFNDQTGKGGCPILANTFAYDVDDAEYPKEWKHDQDGYPLCTAFVDINTPPKKRKPKQKPIPLFESIDKE